MCEHGHLAKPTQRQQEALEAYHERVYRWVARQRQQERIGGQPKLVSAGAALAVWGGSRGSSMLRWTAICVRLLHRIAYQTSGNPEWAERAIRARLPACPADQCRGYLVERRRTGNFRCTAGHEVHLDLAVAARVAAAVDEYRGGWGHLWDTSSRGATGKVIALGPHADVDELRTIARYCGEACTSSTELLDWYPDGWKAARNRAIGR